MAGLGWKVGNWKAKYRVSLPRLSDEEAEIVSVVCDSFREETQRYELTGSKAAEALAKKLLARVCDEQGIEIDSEQQKYLLHTVVLQTWGLGVLEELLSDQSLEEIALIGLDRPIYVFVRGKGWQRTNVSVESQDYFVSLVNRLGRTLGRRLTSQRPRINAVLEDGSRVHASMPPVSSCELTVRKFTRERLTPFDLASFRTYTPRELALLSLVLQSDLSVLFAGNTASGKTSTLNALLSFIPSSERVLLIEETPEILLPHPHQLRLIPFEEGGVGMVELVRDSLRMRPDRVVVGEVRSAEEARAFAESALSGQAKGCYATFHAQSSRDALLRLRMMGCLEADLEGINAIVVQRRVSQYDAKKRKLSEIRKATEIAIANPLDVLRPLVVFDGKNYHQQNLAQLISKICSGSGMSKKEAQHELSSRTRLLSSKAPKGGFAGSFSLLQKSLFGLVAGDS